MLNGLVAGAVLALWVFLLAARGGFWRGAERDSAPAADLPDWPPVTAVIPARDEAESIGPTVQSLLRQDYPGSFQVVLVDDGSSDGTADLARRAAAAVPGGPERLTVLTGAPLPSGWTGKLWAVKQGIDFAEAGSEAPRYLLLTDADITHRPDSVCWLVGHADTTNSVLTSFMAKLRCESLVERIHVPAFIFFFQMLYPFAWVNQRAARTAAAAGGCMLVEAAALRRAGGIGVIRGALIDDCALAQRMKAQGPIWLGLTERTVSLRPYDDWEEARRMVSRSAYAQLRYSPLLLLGTTLGMVFTYFAPPLFAIFGDGLARWFGLAAWALMALAFQPTLRFYRLSPIWGIALPAIAGLYLFYTLDSAWQYVRGRGGSWKGRAQANVSRQ